MSNVNTIIIAIDLFNLDSPLLCSLLERVGDN